MPSDARLVKMALLQNKQLTVLKLGYNNLGDQGASILADGIGSGVLNLQSLDLGFNNIGDVGCAALCRSISERLHTLYLAGNLIGEDGAMAIADLVRRGSSLRKIYLTGNLLGPDGVKAITEAILEVEQRQIGGEPPNGDYPSEGKEMAYGDGPRQGGSMEALYLGGAGMGPSGCQSVARLLKNTHRIRVLSLPNCEINDESVALLAASIKANRDRLPLQSLQLSFNRITCKGIESLANAFGGSRTLMELLLDNNEIADRGAQHIAAVLLPQVTTLETLNLGFNLIKAPGIKILMKAVVDSGSNLLSLSVSGNTVDTSAAKAISYALAYSRSLESLSLVHCNIGHEGQRHITAGIVSNSRTALRELSGFDVGPVVVTLGFPGAMEQWNNSQILNFLRTMWERHRKCSISAHIDGGDATASEYTSPEEEEKLTDPLNFLGDVGATTSAPEDATIVVEVAKKTFTDLVESGGVFLSRQRANANEQTRGSPLVNDDIMLVSSSQVQLHDLVSIKYMDRRNSTPSGGRSVTTQLPTRKVASFVATPENPKQSLPDPARKRRVVEWFSANINDINKLAALPFNSGELWRLHQHYFTPVVNETGGASVAPSPSPSIGSVEITASSVPEVSRTSSTDNSASVGLVAGSHPSMKASGNLLASLPILKRKVSYRFLGEAAAFSSVSGIECRNGPAPVSNQQSIAMMIEGGPCVHSMPPKTKRARRNRSRISFLPRAKAKLDSYLDVCHEKALIAMRQLYYVEQAILRGEVNPIDPVDATNPLMHLCGDLAKDAEMIVVDMI
jgi:Ran GTPase-activating protein (RanGAP) involved in mRNA processing and transport